MKLAKLILFLAAITAAAGVAALPAAEKWLVVERPLEHADAIVVLSGSAEYVARARKAAELYRAGLAPLVILTSDGLQGGWDGTEQRNPYFAELAARELVAAGVPALDIEVLDGAVTSTADEARLVNRAARQRRFRSVMLVTTDYHTARALTAFEREAAATGSLVRYGVALPPPSAEQPSLRRMAAVATESVKYIAYSLFY